MELEGDIGTIGKLKVLPTEKDYLRLDLKGFEYRGHLSPCNSLMIVSIGSDEAKIDSIINSHLSLHVTGSVLDSESVLKVRFSLVLKKDLPFNF